jgi:outer membrane lipopolysaccharide assembly protein LptE/RlpB
MKDILVAPLVAALTIALAGCGYHTGVSKPKTMAAVKKLAVPTFKNDTLYPRLEVLVTNAVIKQLQMAGAYKIVPVSEADAVLRASITDISSRQFRAARNNTLRTSQLQVGLVVKYSVQDVNGQALLNGQAKGDTELVLDPNFQVTEAQALAVAAERLSATLAGEVTEGW